MKALLDGKKIDIILPLDAEIELAVLRIQIESRMKSAIKKTIKEWL